MNGHGCVPVKLHLLWALKVEFQIIFMRHKLVLFEFLPLPLKNTRTVLNLGPYKTTGYSLPASVLSRLPDAEVGP